MGDSDASTAVSVTSSGIRGDTTAGAAIQPTLYPTPMPTMTGKTITVAANGGAGQGFRPLCLRQHVGRMGAHPAEHLVNSLSKPSQAAVEQRLREALQLWTTPSKAAKREKSRVEQFLELTTELLQLSRVSS